MTVPITMWPALSRTLCSICWKALNHPSYSPHLSLCGFHAFGPLKKKQVQAWLRHEGHSGVVVPVEAQRVLCRGDPSTGVAARCVPQHTRELFLMASTPLPKTIIEQVLYYCYHKTSCIEVYHWCQIMSCKSSLNLKQWLQSATLYLVCDLEALQIRM